MVKIVESVSETGPDDELIAVDGGEETPDSTLNKLKAWAKGDDPVGEALEKFLGPETKETVLEKKKDLTDIRKTVRSSTRDVKGQVTEAMGVQLDSVPGMPDKVSEKASKYMGKAANSKFEELKKGNGDIMKVVGGRSGEATAASKTLGKVTGNEDFIKLQNRSALVAGGVALLEMAVDLGIPQLIDGYMGYVDDKKKAKRALIDSVGAAIRRSDLDTVLTIYGHVGSEGIYHRVPEAVIEVLKFFKQDVEISPKENKDKLTELLELLKSDWGLTPDGGVDLKPYITASEDARYILSLPDVDTNDYDNDNPGIAGTIWNNRHIVPMNLGRWYKEQSLSALSLATYPLIKIW